MIARMWESRIDPDRLDAFCLWVREQAWSQLVAAEGFLGGELYRQDVEGRAVVVTRWTDADALAAGSQWFDLGAERYCARPANAWQFTPVPVE